MKRALRILLVFCVLVVCVIAAFAAFVWARSNAVLRRSHVVPRQALAIEPTPAQIARGAHVAMVRGCVACHGADLGGAEVMDNVAMGRVWGPNLTPGRGSVTAGFSDADFARAIRHGIAPDGRGLYLMPSEDYTSLSRGDLSDLIAYLKTARPVDRPSVAIRLGPVARALIATGKMRLAADLIDHDAVRPDDVPRAATADYGRYLSTACSGCHGEGFSGGKITGGPPDWPPAGNLTPSGRLSHWSEAEFERVLKTGTRPDGSQLSPVMPRVFGQMDPVELQALWAFLRTLPARPAGHH